MIEFKLPAIGEGVVEVEIVQWLKQPGEAIATNEALVEVMTDKATLEIPSPHGGVITEHRHPEGSTAAVGDVLCVIDRSGEATAVAAPASTVVNTPAPAPVPAPTPTPAPPPIPAPAPTLAPVASNSRNVMATPAARALARQVGVDLQSVVTESGRITKSDVIQAQQGVGLSSSPVSPVRAPPPPQIASRPTDSGPTPGQRIPFRGIRRKIAESLHHSYSSAVHYTYVDEVDVTRLVALREQAKAAAKAEGVSLNYLPFIIKAVVRALKKFSIVNAMLDTDRSEIVLHDRYDIGIATATEHGLLVPVLRDADRKSLLDIAGEIGVLSDAARHGTAPRDALVGSTFTITSLGTIGGLHATPILNTPEVGILGVHAIRKVPIVNDNDDIVVGRVMNLSVTLDHRIVDGYEGASFLQEVKRILEDPTLLLLAGI